MIMLRANFYNMLLRLQDKGGMQPYEDRVASGDQALEAQLIVSQQAAPYVRAEAKRILAAQSVSVPNQRSPSDANALWSTQ